MVVLFPSGSRPAEASKADDTGLAPKESANETLCRWAIAATSSKGFVFVCDSFGEASLLRPWITQRDDAGQFLPGIIICL
jgi:hypothetical protein